MAYVLWLFFGGLGVHHFFLRRDAHALFGACDSGVGSVVAFNCVACAALLTFNGYGFGWVRDFWRLPEYARLSVQPKPKNAAVPPMGAVARFAMVGNRNRFFFPTPNPRGSGHVRLLVDGSGGPLRARGVDV